MKNKILFSLFTCFSIVITSFSQANLIQEKTIRWDKDSSKWFDDHILFYHYDEHDVLITKELVQWDTSTQNWQFTDYWSYSGNTDGTFERTEHFEWDPTIKIWNPVITEELTYSEEGCLLLRWRDFHNEWSEEKKAEFEYEDSCRVTFELYSTRSSFEPEWDPSNKYENVYDYENRRQTFEGYHHLGGEWIFRNEGYRQYDNQWREIEQLFIYYQPGPYHNKFLHEFATDGSYVKSEEWRAPANMEWFQAYEDSLAFTYDENGWRMSEYLSYTHLPSMPQVRDKRYEYFCDGLLKSQVIEEFTLSGYRHSQTFYTYDTGTHCEEEDRQIDLIFYPNPAHEKVFVQSSLLVEEDAVISIVTVTGVVLLEQKMDTRTDRFEFEVGRLQRGSYFLLIKTDHAKVAEKLFIW